MSGRPDTRRHLIAGMCVVACSLASASARADATPSSNAQDAAAHPASDAQASSGEQLGVDTSPDMSPDSVQTDKSWSGPEAGFRTGFALAGGQIASGETFNPGVGMVPFWFDVGYRLDKYFFVGGYGQFGISIQSKSSCPAGATCHGTDFRFGGSVQAHILPDGKFDPWFGAGMGYEMYDITGSVISGLELVNAQVGLLYKDTRFGGVGPFAAISLGRFSKAYGISIPNPGMHQWIMFGIHGSYWMPM